MLLVKRYNFNKHYNFYFSPTHSCLFIQHFLGTSYFFLPSYFFYSQSLQSCKFIFLNSKFFQSFLTHFNSCISLYYVYFIKIRIRGLGYRLRSICDTCHYFFFNYTNYFFFFNPLAVMVKTYKKRMLLISYNWAVLKAVLAHILLLRKLGPYVLHGLRFAKQIVFLKKRTKKL